MPTVKSLIKAAALTTVEALKDGQALRTVRSSRFLPKAEQPCPYVHLLWLDETSDPEQENYQGYLIHAPLQVWCVVDKYQDAETALDNLAETVMAALEADPTFGGHAISLHYLGDEPFISAAKETVGGNVIHYVVKYRRLRGAPETAY